MQAKGKEPKTFQRDSKGIPNIHFKVPQGPSLPAGQIPRVLQTKALPAWGRSGISGCAASFQGKEHLASSFHRFSSRSTQQQPPDTFTFGPTQSDPKYPHNNGLQERSRLSVSQGSETPGSSRGDNSARAALNQTRGVGVPLFQSSAAPRHSLAHTRLFLRYHKVQSLADVTRVPGELTAGAGQSPGIPSPFGGSFGEIFLWAVAPFICKHICKPMNDPGLSQ